MELCLHVTPDPLSRKGVVSAHGTWLIVGRSVNVLAPLRHISVQVEDPPAVRLLFADRVSFFRAIVRKPGVLPELVRLPEIVWAIFAGPAGVFPFRFGGQAITI